VFLVTMLVITPALQQFDQIDAEVVVGTRLTIRTRPTAAGWCPSGQSRS